MVKMAKSAKNAQNGQISPKWAIFRDFGLLRTPKSDHFGSKKVGPKAKLDQIDHFGIQKKTDFIDENPKNGQTTRKHIVLDQKTHFLALFGAILPKSGISVKKAPFSPLIETRFFTF